MVHFREAQKSTNKYVPMICRRLSDKGSPISHSQNSITAFPVEKISRRFPSRKGRWINGDRSNPRMDPWGRFVGGGRQAVSIFVSVRVQSKTSYSVRTLEYDCIPDPSQFWASLGNFTVVSKSRITVWKQASTSTSTSEANKPNQRE